MNPSLTIRPNAQAIEGAMHLRNECNCKTMSEAVHAALHLFALIPQDVLAQIQACASANARTMNQEMVVLLQEALAVRRSHQEWLAFADDPGAC